MGSEAPDQISYRQIHPYSKNLLDNEHTKKFLPLVSNIAQFSASLQLLLRGFTEFSPDFTTIDLSSYNHTSIWQVPKDRLILINDNVLAGIAQILPRKSIALNLEKCRLTEMFFTKVPAVERLHMLNLSQITSLSDKSAAALANTCKYLRYLRVWQTITDTGLLELQKLENLRTLDLTECKVITCRGVCSLLRKLTNLNGFIIDECANLTDETLNTLARTHPNLERFSMERGRFSERAILSFIHSAKSLLSLGVGGWGVQKSVISDRVIHAIVSTSGSRIQSLGLYRSEITDEGLLHLVTNCSQITELNIGNITTITDPGISFLARLKSLQRVELMATNITDYTLLSLVRANSFKELSLHRCRMITAKGISAAMEYLRDCTFLCLKDTAADDSIWSKLSNMPNLKTIDLRRTEISPTALKEIAAIPGLTVFRDGESGDPDGRLSMTWDLPNTRTVNIHKRKRSL